jgi:YegS/Rv2252/BmrU family lipid kinase
MITLLVNPTAGGGKAKNVANAAIARLKELNLPFRIWETHAPGEAEALAARAAKEYEHIPHEKSFLLSVGGDGTFLEVVQGVLGSELPIASLPAGTGNDFLKSLKVPLDPKQALEHILNATVRRIDIGKINDLLFANECGAGFDVTVLDYANQYRKKIKSSVSYLLGVVRAIFSHRSAPMIIEADGNEVFRGECLVFSVANGKFIGGGIPISPNADIQSGKLELIIMKDCSRPRMCSYLPGLLGGKILEFKDTVVQCRADTIKVRSMTKGQSLRVNIDGEIRDLADCNFSILPQALPIHM